MEEVIRVLGGGGQDLGGEDLQELYRVVAGVLPGGPVQHFIKHAGGGMPGPPEIEGQFPQAGEPLRQVREPGLDFIHGRLNAS